MASSPVKFLYVFLLISIVGWVVFIFFSRLLTWFLSRILGASVQLRVAGCNCLRDVNVKFKKGAVDSISVGEIKLSLRKSLVKLGFSFISRDPKLRLLISDLEIVIRTPEKRAGGKHGSSQKSRTISKGKWMLVASVARFFSVSITDLAVKAPQATVDIKDLMVDISKLGHSNSLLLIKLHLLPILINVCDRRPSFEQIPDNNLLEGLPAGQSLSAKISAPFICEDLSLACELGHERDTGVKVRDLDVTCGMISMSIDESLLVKSKTKSDINQSNNSGDRSFAESSPDKESPNDHKSHPSRRKPALLLPDKVSFNLPKLDFIFLHEGYHTSVENNVMGIRLKSTKSYPLEESDEATAHFDILLDLTEIHLIREGRTSTLEIMRVAAVASVDVPMLSTDNVRAEIDVKLGGTQCNLIMSRLTPWIQLLKSKKKPEVLRAESTHPERSAKKEKKSIKWTCTVSAPEMAIMLYDLNGLPLYLGCSQSSHLFANNIACKGIQLHTELGEIHLQRADEYHECLKENIFSVETNPGSLMHIARISLDWGYKDIESSDENDCKQWTLISSADITGMGLFFNLQQFELLSSTVTAVKSLLQSFSSGKKATQKRSDKAGGTVMQILKFNLEKCVIKFCGDILIEDAVVPDPKRVNFGSHGGSVVFDLCPDGVPRTAAIASTMGNGKKHINYLTSLEIFHLSSSMNKSKKSLQMEILRTKAVYDELPEEESPGTKVILFDVKNMKLVRRTGGFNEISVCSLFRASDITMRWEPDAHFALYELFLRLKLILQKQKLKSGHHNKGLTKDKNEGKIEESPPNKAHKTRDSVFAIDVEMLRLSAEVADGVEATLHVQSIFSENARIGMLLEGLILSFNESRVLKSSRMQISRVPVSIASPHDPRAQVVSSWDWLVQGLDVHVCMPYRLQLRAIEDAVEDMLRALKLVTSAMSSALALPKKDASKKTKKKSSFGSVKFNIRKLTADIEEEPLQGWLDEHYHIMKNVVCESSIRMKFLDDVLSEKETQASEKKMEYNGVTIDFSDLHEITKLKNEIHRQAFRSYHAACQNLSIPEGSGACKRGFQAGFRPSTARSSLLCLSATELDLTLKEIEGGNDGMLQFVNKIDPVSLESDIPFSRFYGSELILQTSSLILQLRNYTFPLFSGYSGRCEGTVVLAQQATCFQPQIYQDMFIGRWRRLRLMRSASGTTPAMKMYSDLPIFFDKGQVSFGVGYEPAFADISYAFTVALRRANLSIRSLTGNNANYLSTNSSQSQPAKKERSLPWWDDMRYYIHGKINLSFNQTEWNFPARTNPYEKIDKLQISTGLIDIQQSDGHVILSAKEFKVFQTSLHSLTTNCSLKAPPSNIPFIDSPTFCLEVDMDWECESGKPLNHYLHALPKEGKPREKVYDPFRSVSLSLRWNFSLRPFHPHDSQNVHDGSPLNSDDGNPSKCPTMYLGAHDLVWIFKWWNLNYSPPHKLRTFSRWPRFGVPRATRSGNLSLDKVMTELFLRLDSTPTCIKHMPLCDDDPATGLTFETTKLKYELCYSRGKQLYTFECKRDTLDLIYQGLDLHLFKAYLNIDYDSDLPDGNLTKKTLVKGHKKRSSYPRVHVEKHQDEGFLLYSDYFTIRKQAPKADPERLLSWQNAGRRNLEMSYVRSEFENGSDCTRSDPSDDDGYNVVIADNCQRIFVYGLKLLWTIENRDAVWSWVGGISKAFEPPKPSPSRQYAQRKLIDQKRVSEKLQSTQEVQPPAQSTLRVINSQSPQHGTTSGKNQEVDDFDVEGIRHFMVNVIQPQFNLQSEEANGRFLLAAASGRLLARSLDSLVHIGSDMIEQLSSGNINIQEDEKPQMVWKRVEYSAMLEHVQAHVAPTDVDPGAGLQWLPKILRSSPKVKRTGALLERVFMPCTMYFRYSRHKGATTDLKVKPLKELSFNSENITATMTSRQFQVMLDILSNLLFARLPKPRKSSLSYPAEDDDVEEEADEVVPDGVEEVELAKIILEQRERERKLLLDDIRGLLSPNETPGDASSSSNKDCALWMVHGEKSLMVQCLKKELVTTQKSRKAASSALRTALQKAALLRIMEKEKNKSPSCAMRISMKIDKVVWSMLSDGKSFAEAEIINMMYDFDRDYKDIGVAQFITKSFFVRNCLPNAKSDMLLSAWNAPPDLGRNVMLRVDARQGAPKEGNSMIERLEVEIYPLKIHLTETMYRMMWGYFFPEEEQDSHRRQEVWKVSTTAGSRRAKKIPSGLESLTGHLSKDAESSASVYASNLLSSHVDSSQSSKYQSLKANIICGSSTELRRASSFDQSTEENLGESTVNVPSAQLPPSGAFKSGPLGSPSDHPSNANEESAKNKSKVVKAGKSQDEKRSRPRKLMDFHNIKISQVELLVTYEGSRFAVNDLRLLMDTFHRDAFTGTWRRLFSRVKKHIIWGVLKSVTGMQGKKFKHKAVGHREEGGMAEGEMNLSDSDGGVGGKSAVLKRQSDGAGEGFVTSVRGLFNSQRRRAKAFVRRTMRGDADADFHEEGSDTDAEELHGGAPFARQLTITKRLIRRHTKKFRGKSFKNSAGSSSSRVKESLPSSPKETTPFESDFSSDSSYEDVYD